MFEQDTKEHNNQNSQGFDAGRHHWRGMGDLWEWLAILTSIAWTLAQSILLG